MENLMTIQAFSERTGIPKSALRFYESKNLIKSKRDTHSGYRFYAAEQVPVAKQIASLRSADIPIKDIQLYLQLDEAERKKMMQQWIEKIKEKQKVLEISLRYLESGQNETVYLIEKRPEKVLWFQAEGVPGGFFHYFKLYRDILKKQNIPVVNIYLKYISGNRKAVKVEIGFGIDGKGGAVEFTNAKMEEMPACICIALPYEGSFIEIEAGYRKLFDYAMEYNLVPVGAIFEWYHGDQFEKMDLVMPVIKMGE